MGGRPCRGRWWPSEAKTPGMGGLWGVTLWPLSLTVAVSSPVPILPQQQCLFGMGLRTLTRST